MKKFQSRTAESHEGWTLTLEKLGFARTAGIGVPYASAEFIQSPALLESAARQLKRARVNFLAVFPDLLLRFIFLRFCPSAATTFVNSPRPLSSPGFPSTNWPSRLHSTRPAAEELSGGERPWRASTPRISTKAQLEPPSFEHVFSRSVIWFWSASALEIFFDLSRLLLQPFRPQQFTRSCDFANCD